MWTAALVLAAGLAVAGCRAPASRPDSTGVDTLGTQRTAGLFTAPNAWNRDVSTIAKSASSDAVIGWLSANGGWGTGEVRIDFSINVLSAGASTPFESFTPTSDFYTPDCDHVPFPVPPGGALEGEPGYDCTGGGDCHLLVVDRPDHELFEMWRADFTGGAFNGGCAVVWDLSRSYGPSLRGENCTSADAAGLPVTALLFTADEVAAGSIDHAVRFILPNDRILPGAYVHPATHTTRATSGGADAPPYGTHLRLRASYPLAQLAPGAQVVARALQRYGMILADGGSIALTAASDRFTTHTWSEVGVGADSLAAIQVTDMEVVDLDATVPYDGDCVRVP
jgi:serine/threonine-protein kinase